MFLVEPPRSAYDLNFRLGPIPVRVHPLFWLGTLLLVASEGVKSIDVVIWTAAVFISILVHELGHALVIRYYGWRPRIILYMLGGLAAYEPTWHRMWPQIIISLAGPAAGFLLAALVAVAIRVSGHEVQVAWNHLFPMPIRYEAFASRNLTQIVDDLLLVNILWGFLNLLPIHPLDGGKIARELLERFNPSQGMSQTLKLSIFTAVGMACVLFFKLDAGRTALFFVIFAAMNYVELQQYSGRYGGRGW